jgi:sec-independent protein translocase protein TatA
VLGPKRLPEVGRSLGKGLRDFKSALGGEEQAPHAEVLNQTSAENTKTSSESAEHFG